MKAYVHKDGVNLGPYPVSQLKKYLEAKNFTGDDLACCDGVNWIKLSQVPGIAETLVPKKEQSTLNVYIHKDSVNLGPYSLSQLRKYLDAKNFTGDDLACCDGVNWIKLSQVPGISETLVPKKEQSTLKTQKLDKVQTLQEEAGSFKETARPAYKTHKKTFIISGAVLVSIGLITFFVQFFLGNGQDISLNGPPPSQGSKLVHVSSTKAVHLDPDILNSFLSSHCTKCHGPHKQKGETRLDTLALNISNSDMAQHWQDVLDVLNLGEMPPEEEKQPNKDELQAVIKLLTDALDTSKKRLSEDGGNIALRRINRREYRHTIHQLLGMRIGIRVGKSILPENSITEGYDTIGQDQQFSSHHFDNYFEAGKSIATAALYWVDREKNDVKSHTYEAEIQHKHLRKKRDNLSKYLDFAKERGGYIDRRKKNMHASIVNYLNIPYNDKGVFLLESSKYPGLESFRFMVDPRATYKFKVKAGLVAEPPAIRSFLKVSIGNITIGYLKVSGSLDSPVETQTLEYQPLLVPTTTSTRYNVRENKVGSAIADYLEKLGVSEKKAAIWVDTTTVEGPFYKDPSAIETIYKQTIATVDTDKGDQELDLQVKQFLKTFMYKAFRGKGAAPGYQDRVFKIYGLERDQGKAIKEALITPLAMILSSPSFLYLMEDAPASKEGTVNEMEFANRISHFLWSRPASDQFLADAKAGKLKDDQLLRKQIDSMLKHKNSFALSEGFFSQWVDLKRFDDVGIDESIHIKFNKGIQDSSKLEVQHFFHTLVKENMSLAHLIDSDFVVINDLLALHYGLEMPNNGEGFQKVNLPADSQRGGLLGTVAFLTMGSNGERSSPIIRGALIQDKFFNRKPPPPPPNVPELENASKEPLPVKEAIELHRQKVQCASCHSSFDPLGLGLENFDLIGLWRDQETIRDIESQDGTPKDTKQTLIPVRAEGVFPNKKPFHNLDEFRSGLMAHKHLLARSITEGLLSYGLGRHIEFADQQALDEICKEANQNNQQIGDIIYHIISHPLFRRADRAENTALSKI